MNTKNGLQLEEYITGIQYLRRQYEILTNAFRVEVHLWFAGVETGAQRPKFGLLEGNTSPGPSTIAAVYPGYW